MQLTKHIRRTAGVTTLLTLAAAPALAQGYHGGHYLPLDDVQLAGGAVVVNGNASISAPRATFSVQERSMIADLTIEGALTAEVTAEAQVGFAHSAVFPGAILPPIIVSPDTVIQPLITLEVDLSGIADIGMRTSFIQHFQVTAEIEIDMDAGMGVSVRGVPTRLSRYGTPGLDVGGTAELEVAVESDMIFIVISNSVLVPGPEIGVRFGTELSMDTAADPWWTLDGFTEIEAGVNLLGFGLIEETVFTESFPLGQAPGPLGSDALPIWARTFDLGDTEDATSIVPKGDGFVIAGNGQGPNNQAWYAELNADGEKVWDTMNNHDPIGSRPEQVHVLSTGDILAGGLASVNGEARIELFEADGNVKLTQIIQDDLGDALQLKSIQPTPTGYVFAGRVNRGSSKYPILIYTDGRGAIQDAFEYDFGPESDDGGFEVLEPTEDGGFIAAGFVHWQDSPNFIDQTIAGVNGLVCKISPTRSLEYARVIGNTGSDKVLDCAPMSDGGVAICGRVGNSQTVGWVALLDDQGNTVWTHCYGGDVDTGNDELTGIDTVVGGGFLVTGKTGLGASRDAWMFMLSPDGMPLWFKSLRSPDGDVLVDVTSTGDGIIACGQSFVHGPNAAGHSGDVWAIRTDIDGMLHFDPSNGFDAVNDMVQWSRTSTIVNQPFFGGFEPLAVTSSPAPLRYGEAKADTSLLTD